jgi:hypothetical protein
MALVDAVQPAHEPGKKEARLKLRQLLRQLVNDIWILVAPLSKTRRVAAVQVFFESGARRDYLIFTQDAGNGRQAGAWVDSVDPEEAADLDLRQREDAAAYEKRLGEWDYAGWLTDDRRV